MRFLSSWQGLLAGIIGILLFLFSPFIIYLYDPTSGVVNAGFLHFLISGITVYLFTIFFAWIGFQISFPSMDKWADKNIGEAFEGFTQREKFLYAQAGYLTMLIDFIICLIIVF